jgi:hypothetical protein
MALRGHTELRCHVRFRGQSGHGVCIAKCPLMTQSGHFDLQASSDIDPNVVMMAVASLARIEQGRTHLCLRARPVEVGPRSNSKLFVD